MLVERLLPGATHELSGSPFILAPAALALHICSPRAPHTHYICIRYICCSAHVPCTCFTCFTCYACYAAHALHLCKLLCWASSYCFKGGRR